MNAIHDYKTICEEAVRAGGAAVLDWIGRIEVQKKGPADLVTQADFASQEVIAEIVFDAFPDHALLGEEDSDAQAAAQQAEYRWVVDPLDGTTNFVHRVPHFSVSLALERRGELLVGAVYDPTRDECFTAVAGEGASLNGRPICTSGVSDLPEALAAVGFPPGSSRNSPDAIVFLEALKACQAIRRTGSSALNLCYLAAGRFDVYWSFSTKVWDVAAGVLMVREAGGKVTSPDGGPFILNDARFLAAANDTLHRQLQELVARALA
ncbi:MAG: inositol monophosphatase [Pirellulales bacterium]|nr:inositol monophosphatase [Pirellulales bacterium]